MLLHAEKAEVRRGSGPHGGVPFVGPSHSHGDRVSRVDLHMHVAATDRGMVDAAGLEAGGRQRDRLAVGSSPVKAILRVRVRGEGAEQQRSENRKFPHTRSICWPSARTLANSRAEDYEGTRSIVVSGGCPTQALCWLEWVLVPHDERIDLIQYLLHRRDDLVGDFYVGIGRPLSSSEDCFGY
jgi:hypothetical protein